MPHTKISFSVFVNSLAILNHRKFGDSFSTESPNFMQSGLSLPPDHETNGQPSSQERCKVADPETFEDLLYLYSSEDKYKGFSLY